jgi:hypothetical protein
MDKLVLLSVLIALVTIPVLSARDRNQRRGLKRALFLVVAFNLFYMFALRFIYPRVL